MYVTSRVDARLRHHCVVRFHVGFPLKAFLIKCCPQTEEEKTACVEQTVS